MANRKLANRVKELRHRHSWSQSHLAEAAGLSKRTIQRVEKEGECSRETLLSIAAAFDVDVTSLTALVTLESESAVETAEHGRGITLSLQKYISGDGRLWQRRTAMAGALLMIIPVSFILVMTVKYSLGYKAFPNPFEALYATQDLLQTWNLVSPFLFLGSLLLALGLNLLPFLDLKISTGSNLLLSRVGYRGNAWNRMVVVLSVLVIAAMLGYVTVENIAEHAIGRIAH